MEQRVEQTRSENPTGEMPRALWISAGGQYEVPASVAVEAPNRSMTEIALEHLPVGVLGDESLKEAADRLATIVIAGSTAESTLDVARTLRKRVALDRARLYLACDDGMVDADVWMSLDIEDVLPASGVTSEKQIAEVIGKGIGAWRALGNNPLIPKYYLDAKYNDVFDWFENTRWSWTDIDLTQIDESLITEGEIEILKESAIIEFGTLPGAHNFLREWSDEYSFSSWALSWGAEEARHSLVQSRYLRALGIETMAKHAMYKREPYPLGYNRAATLMMNVISECRAAEYYRRLSANAKEPVLKKIWKLLGHDEARHARAFVLFCRELCQLDKENLVAALEMAYVFLADRSEGVKHPAGYFYPHSTSTNGLRATEDYLQQNDGESITSRADRRVIAILRSMTGDPTLRDISGIRRNLRELM